ncbi:MAG: hypothetical protein H0T42_10230, partial [Deltaproteobacteria bacterium]|nr:hypothetical protein [Deltaproteobacteria bacterium]
CWGDNRVGQLGNGTTTRSYLGVQLGGNETDWSTLSAGQSHACGVRADGSLWCWGDNSRGAVPNPNTGLVSSLPSLISPSAADSLGDRAWSSVALGAYHTCAIDDLHHLWCAGGSASGQLGRDAISHLGPTQVDGRWSALDAGPAFTCALDDASEAHCWGNNIESELGNGSSQDQLEPTPILGPGPWEGLTVGESTGCVRRGSSRIRWGLNSYGELGNNGQSRLPIPEQIDGGPWPTAASHHACGISSEVLSCWGANNYGQIGKGMVTTANQLTPLVVASAYRWMRITVGRTHTCGVNNDGLYCWCNNADGLLGTGSTASLTSAVPQKLSAVQPEALTLGENHSCAILNGTASCWGANNHGEIGNRTRTRAPVPVPIVGSWRQLSAGTTHTCGISTTGMLSCWGDNEWGQVGDGTIADRLEPTLIGSDMDWDHVVAAKRHTCARKTSGELWCWGHNLNGELGDGRAWSRALARVP